MIRFAAFSDLHYDHVFDGDRRIDEFINKIKSERLNFIISLGDLCYPIEQNKHILDKLISLNIPVFYVVGNHDLDSFSQEDIMSFLNVDSLNYSFIIENTKFIVMNSFYMGQKKILDSQLEWLKQELDNEEQNYVVFSHHSLANDFNKRGIENRDEIRKILSSRKAILCMNGHDHGTDYKVIGGIHYYTLNSMSYIWHGLKEVYPYGDEIHSKYPYLKDLILYKDALHSIVEIDNDYIRIVGMESDYLSTTPEDVGISNRKWNGVSIEPRVIELEKSVESALDEADRMASEDDTRLYHEEVFDNLRRRISE